MTFVSWSSTSWTDSGSGELTIAECPACVCVYWCYACRSKYVIAMMDYDAPGEGSSFLSFRKGDLIHLGDNEQGEDVMNSGWCFGQSEKTSAKGDFPAECVYILPTITKPSHEVIMLFASRTSEETERILATTNSALDYGRSEAADDLSTPPYTLESYALDHFLPAPKRTLSKALAKGTLTLF